MILPLLTLTLPSSQGFSSRETDFHFHQFLSNIFQYSFSNFLLSYLNKIFAIYFSSNSLLLNSPASRFHFAFHHFSIPSCLLTSALVFPSNSSTNSLAFSKFSSFSQVSFSAVNSFHHIRYLFVPYIFLLFKIFSTSHSSTLSTSIGFIFSVFWPPTCSLYHTTQLTFTTRWILIKVGSRNLTTLVDTTSSIVYGLTY